MSETQFKMFREALRVGIHGPTMYALATIQFYQALRISEAAALHWQDVILDGSTPSSSRIEVRRSAFWPRRKGVVSTVKARFKNSKSHKHGVKEQPMFPESYAVLSQLNHAGSAGLVFAVAGELLEYRTIQHAYDVAFAKANLPFRGTHILRHGGTRRVYNQCSDVEAAKQLLGNSDLATAQVYAKRSVAALTDFAKGDWLHRERRKKKNVSSTS